MATGTATAAALATAVSRTAPGSADGPCQPVRPFCYPRVVVRGMPRPLTRRLWVDQGRCRTEGCPGRLSR